MTNFRRRIADTIKAWRPGTTPTMRLEQDRAEFQHDLLELAAELTQESGFDGRMERLCSRTRALLGCDRCSIFMLDGDAYQGRFNSGNPPDIEPHFRRHRVPLNDPLVAEALAQRCQVMANDAQHDPRMNKTIARRARINSIVIAPLCHGDHEPRGFVTAEFNESGRTFSEDQSKLFGGIAKVISLAIEHEESRKQHDQITARIEAESHFASLGRFAGGVAHDFNNRLTVIIGRGEQIAAQTRGTYLEGEVEELMRSAEAAAGLTQRLLEFSTSGPRTHGECDVTQSIEAIQGFLRRLVPEDIDFSIGIHDNDLIVLLARQDLERILSNLVLNAVDATDSGGRIQIDISAVKETDSLSGEWSELGSGAYLSVTVQDSGSGIPAEDQERIFEPFYTTEDGAPGLGLTVVARLVRRQNGAIRVESHPGKGTRFVIMLPSRREAVPEDLDARTDPVLTGGTGTILLVDDDEPVRRFVRTVLEQHGHRVLEASNGSAALALAADENGPIHLLATDIVMPEMNGTELARELQKQIPELQVLYWSGYAPGFRDASELKSEASSFIPKPFSSARILEEVDSRLARLGQLH